MRSSKVDTKNEYPDDDPDARRNLPEASLAAAAQPPPLAHPSDAENSLTQSLYLWPSKGNQSIHGTAVGSDRSTNWMGPSL